MSFHASFQPQHYSDNGTSSVQILPSEPCPIHLDKRQIRLDSLNRRNHPIKPLRPTVMCNHSHLTWEWLMGSPLILKSMSTNYHSQPYTTSKLKGQTVARSNIMAYHLTHYSGFLFSTIKILLRHKQGACSDHLSGHPLCRKEAHPISSLLGCQHPLEVDRQLWVVRTTLTGVKAWKDANERVSNMYNPYFTRLGDLRKRMTSCVPKYRHQAPLISDNLRACDQPLYKMTTRIFLEHRVSL
ncbi:hypothetical protein AAG906_012965 [Vitis piasezkii]